MFFNTVKERCTSFEKKCWCMSDGVVKLVLTIILTPLTRV